MDKGSKKVSLLFGTELLARIDSYATSLDINRTSAIKSLLSQALDQREAIDMLGLVQKLQDLQEKQLREKAEK